MKKLQIIGSLMGFLAMSMAWYFYGWKLALILFLAIWSNNLEQSKKRL